MSSSLFHIARPQLPSETKKMSRLLLPLAAEMALVLVLALAAKTAMMTVTLMMKMIPILTSTGMKFMYNTQMINGDINGEENVELSGFATAAARRHT